MEQLSDKERSLVAFAMFTAAMRIGPDVFPTMETIAGKLGITDQYVGYASDWLGYSKTVAEAAKRSSGMFRHHPVNDPGFVDLDNNQRFAIWLAELYYTTANETGLQPAEIKINEAEARKFFNDGFTPYQCFRETWNMENDAGV